MIDAFDGHNPDMKSSFGKTLFRQLLLFSMVPTVLMAAAGYYLAVESISLRAEATEPGSAIPATYYNDLLFDRIDKSLHEWLEDSSAAETFLDFVFAARGDSVATLQVDEALDETAVSRVLRAGRSRDRGFVELDSAVIQFMVRNLDDHAVYAGIVHDEGFAYLLRSIQTDYASRTSGAELQSKVAYFIAAVLAVLASATVLLAYLLSRRSARSLASPLLQLSRASERIAEGDFRQEVGLSAKGEIGVLTENFNRMVRRLEATTARLAQTERVAAWRQIARRFAHELRNPLQPVLVSLYRIEKVLRNSPEYAKVQEPLRAATEEIRHLTTLADRFSQLAKLPPPSIRRTNFNELMKSISDLYREQLTPYDFHLHLPHEQIVGDLDEGYFREVVHNLLSNAIDASGAGARICLSLGRSDDKVEITITDFGQGMTPEVLSSARMPYFTTKKEGSGIGLAVVEKIVGEMGGQVVIESAVGEGTKVSVLLPVAE